MYREGWKRGEGRREGGIKELTMSIYSDPGAKYIIIFLYLIFAPTVQGRCYSYLHSTAAETEALVQ